MEAAAYCMDQGAPIERLDDAITHLNSRATDVRQFVVDVKLEIYPLKPAKGPLPRLRP